MYFTEKLEKVSKSKHRLGLQVLTMTSILTSPLVQIIDVIAVSWILKLNETHPIFTHPHADFPFYILENNLGRANIAYKLHAFTANASFGQVFSVTGSN